MCIHFLDLEKRHVVAPICSEMKVESKRNAEAIKYREWNKNITVKYRRSEEHSDRHLFFIWNKNILYCTWNKRHWKMWISASRLSKLMKPWTQLKEDFYFSNAFLAWKEPKCTVQLIENKKLSFTQIKDILSFFW